MKWQVIIHLVFIISVAIAYAVAKGWKAILTMVLIPLKDAGIALFQSQTKNLEAQSAMMEKHGVTMEKTNETMQRVCTELSETRRDVALIKAQTERCRILSHDRPGSATT